MRQKHLNLTSWQAVAASEKRLHRIIVPMKEQPQVALPIGYTIKEFTHVEKWAVFLPDGNSPACCTGWEVSKGRGQFFTCPFSVGDVIELKEIWSSLGDGLIYKCDHDDPSTLLWNSASSMPSWAIRHRFQVKSIEASKIGYLSDVEIDECGFPRLTQQEVDGTRLLDSAILWNDQYRRHPALKWRPDLWVWSMGGWL